MRNSISNAQTHHDCRKTFIILSLRHASKEKLYKVIWRTCWTNSISVTHQKKTMRRLVFAYNLFPAHNCFSKSYHCNHLRSTANQIAS